MSTGLPLLQRCWVVDGKQPYGKIKDLDDSTLHKLLGELGFSLLGKLSDKDEWQSITRLAAYTATRLPTQQPSHVVGGAAAHVGSRAAGSSASSAKGKPQSKKPATPNLRF